MSAPTRIRTASPRAGSTHRWSFFQATRRRCPSATRTDREAGSRSALEKDLSAAVAFFALRHALVIDRLAVAHRLDQNAAGRDAFPDDLGGDRVGALLRLLEDGHEVLLDRHV